MLTQYPAGRQALRHRPSGSTCSAPPRRRSALVEDHTGLRIPTLADLSEIERSSQLIVEGERAARVLPGDRRRRHRPSDALARRHDPDAQAADHRALRRTEDRSRRPPSAPARTTAPTTRVEVFAALLEAFVDRQADLLEQTRERLDEISHGVFRASPQQLRRVARSNEQLRGLLQPPRPHRRAHLDDPRRHAGVGPHRRLRPGDRQDLVRAGAAHPAARRAASTSTR